MLDEKDHVNHDVSLMTFFWQKVDKNIKKDFMTTTKRFLTSIIRVDILSVSLRSCPY